LEYWFSKKKNEFYKFIEPCAHPCYREGDSWSEELGFSKLVFRNAFDKIGTRYISKTAFEKEGDPFKGKLFASYRDRQSKKTFFVRNNTLLNTFYDRLKGLVSKTTTALQKTFNLGKTNKSIPIKNLPSRRAGYRSSYADANKDKHINTSSKKEENCFSKEGGDGQISDKQSQIAQEMKEVWANEIGSRGLVNLTPEFIQRMIRAYEGLFQGSMDRWRAYCLKIASSKFLMGEKEGTNYEIRLPVALTEKFKDQVEEGRYELATRETNEDKRKKEASQKLKARAVKQEIIENALENLERQRVMKPDIGKIQRFAAIICVVEIIREINQRIDDHRLPRRRQGLFVPLEADRFVQNVILEQPADWIVIGNRPADCMAVQGDRTARFNHVAELCAIHWDLHASPCLHCHSGASLAAILPAALGMSRRGWAEISNPEKILRRTAQ